MDFNFTPTFSAVLPDIPESISSNISVSMPSFFAKTLLIASMILESSPPEAILSSGFTGSPGFVAIKSVFAKKDGIDTLIFDEIDSGISGRTAEKVGVKLKSIAKDIQVVCVTHSAQIASLADAHYLIEKNEVGGRSVTNIKELNKEERINEIARIMGGITITETVRNTAAEMVNRNVEG